MRNLIERCEARGRRERMRDDEWANEGGERADASGARARRPRLRRTMLRCPRQGDAAGNAAGDAAGNAARIERSGRADAAIATPPEAAAAMAARRAPTPRPRRP
ncbi:hypothetical protein EGT86_22315 [Burkholderia pseudomallei]|nr:hypothetical protein EGT86_22315 [Burkholderia pseudomallei]